MLERGISPASSNENLMSVIHFAVDLEKIEFLNYLLFGNYVNYRKLYNLEDF